jgi:multiple sugar transport system substrate-binding protein
MRGKWFGGAVWLGLMLVLPVIAGPAAGQTTVTMWSFLDPAKKSPREVALRQIIDNFERGNPGIKIKVDPQIFSELGTKFLLGHRTGAAPDVTFVNGENLTGLIKAGAAADLQQLFLARWTKEADADMYVRAGWDAPLVDGKRYAVPLFQGSTVLYFRKDLFRQAGIDPATLKTWDDFTEAAKKLTTGNVWGLATPLATERTGGTSSMLSMLTAAEGAAWDEQGCKPRYATPGGVKVIGLHADWITRDKIMPRDALTNDIDTTMDLFAAGRYAMAVGAIFQYTQLQQKASWNKAELGVLPWPNWNADRYGPQWVSGWWVSAWSRSPRLTESGKFLEHLISPESVKIWTMVGGQIPSRLSVFDDPELQKPELAYLKTVVEGWRNWSFLLPRGCNTARFDSDLNGALHAVVVGGTDPMKALRDAEAKFVERQ